MCPSIRRARGRRAPRRSRGRVGAPATAASRDRPRTTQRTSAACRRARICERAVAELVGDRLAPRRRGRAPRRPGPASHAMFARPISALARRSARPTAGAPSATSREQLVGVLELAELVQRPGAAEPQLERLLRLLVAEQLERARVVAVGLADALAPLRLLGRAASAPRPRARSAAARRSAPLRRCRQACSRW